MRNGALGSARSPLKRTRLADVRGMSLNSRLSASVSHGVRALAERAQKVVEENKKLTDKLDAQA